MFHSGAKPPHNLPYPLDLLKLRFELVNLVQDRAEPGDFRVGHLDRVAGAVVLGLGCGFGGAVELWVTDLCVRGNTWQEKGKETCVRG